MPVTSVPVPLRWSDMDAYGHVNNVQYLRLLEEARISAFAQWFGGEGSEAMVEGGVIVARQEIEYVRPLVYGQQPARVDLWVSRIGGSSFEIGYEVRDEGAGEPCALAETTMAAFDLGAQRPRRLGQDERSALAARLDDPVRLRRRR